MIAVGLWGHKVKSASPVLSPALTLEPLCSAQPGGLGRLGRESWGAGPGPEAALGPGPGMRHLPEKSLDWPADSARPPFPLLLGFPGRCHLASSASRPVPFAPLYPHHIYLPEASPACRVCALPPSIPVGFGGPGSAPQLRSIRRVEDTNRRLQLACDGGCSWRQCEHRNCHMELQSPLPDPCCTAGRQG